MRKHGGTPSRRDKHVTLAAISPPGVARGGFVGGQQSDLAGCKLPPLFTRGASSCSSQGRCQGEPWGASPRPSAPTYLPTFLPLRKRPTMRGRRTGETYHTGPTQLEQPEPTLRGVQGPTHPTAGQADHWAAKTTAYQPEYWQQHNNRTRGRPETGQTTKKHAPRGTHDVGDSYIDQTRPAGPIQTTTQLCTGQPLAATTPMNQHHAPGTPRSQHIHHTGQAGHRKPQNKPRRQQGQHPVTLARAAAQSTPRCTGRP